MYGVKVYFFSKQGELGNERELELVRRKGSLHHCYGVGMCKEEEKSPSEGRAVMSGSGRERARWVKEGEGKCAVVQPGTLF